MDSCLASQRTTLPWPTYPSHLVYNQLLLWLHLPILETFFKGLAPLYQVAIGYLQGTCLKTKQNIQHGVNDGPVKTT